MSDIVSLTERRWDGDRDTRNHSVVDMLRVTISRIERGEIKADHGILIMGQRDKEANSCGVEWMQAGGYDFFSQLGLIERAKSALISDAEQVA